jgi:pimeloyl-ACP methyl ester carboxylesterase
MMVGRQQRMGWIAAFILISLFCSIVFSKQTVRPSNESRSSRSIELYFESYGEGPPILMLHGFGGNLYTWRHLIQPLTERNRLILIDLKGFGKSPKPKDNLYGLQDQADLIYQFIVDNDLRGLTLVGHSLGGAIALLVSLKLIKEKPEFLSTLVLIDSAGYRQKLPFVMRILRTPIIRSIAFAFLSDKKMVRLTLEKAYFDDAKITRDQVSAYAEPLGSDGARHALVRTLNKLGDKNIDKITRQYSEITVPTLIIWGRKDEVIKLEIGEALRKAITNSEIKIIEECGHIPHEEKPAETIKILRTFLQQHMKR